MMKRRLTLTLATVALLLVVPATSLAKPPSFALWWNHFSSRVQSDVTHVGNVCQKRYGHNNAKLSACFVKTERVSLRAERAAWEKGIAIVARNQQKPCKRAIQAYSKATRRAAQAHLVYLDSHPRAALAKISRDLSGKPYVQLNDASVEAKVLAARICG
jgi:hypothetical protein